MKSFTVPAIILSIGLVLAAFVAAREVRVFKESAQVIKVVGSAKKPLTSDYALLSATISSGGESLTAALTNLEKQKKPLLQFLAQKGFAEESATFSPMYESSLSEYDKNGMRTGKVIRYGYSQQFELEHGDVEKVQELSLSLSELTHQGVFIKVNQPQYLYTKLSEIKVEVQALAAADAKARALKIAEATGSKLGPIRSARMGVLQITPSNSTVISDYGMNDTSSIEKDITAVVSASFQVR